MDLKELKRTFTFKESTTNKPPRDNNFFLNSLIDEFGDIPQVRTYFNLQKKIREKERITFDEIIALASAALYLYPSEAKAADLKKLEAIRSQLGAEELAKITYVWIDVTHGDSIEIHYPDGSKKMSGMPVSGPPR